MKQAAGLVLLAMLLSGCVAYVGRHAGRPGAGIYVTPSPVVVAPVHGWWGWRRG